jgi:hypothetical protein
MDGNVTVAAFALTLADKAEAGAPLQRQPRQPAAPQAEETAKAEEASASPPSRPTKRRPPAAAASSGNEPGAVKDGDALATNIIAAANAVAGE